MKRFEHNDELTAINYQQEGVRLIIAAGKGLSTISRAKLSPQTSVNNGGHVV